MQKNKHNRLKHARKVHRLLMLFAGLQFIFWSVTGLYMVVMDIHFIHGESLHKPDSKNQQMKVDLTQVDFNINALLSAYPDASGIKLKSLAGQPVYQLLSNKQTLLVDATNGKLLPAITDQQARAIAQAHFFEQRKIIATAIIASNPPSELSPRHLPAWQVVFDGATRPTFYIQQYSGDIVTTRHSYWRIFDWMWRFHIMDYDDGENIQNWLLFVFSLTGLIAVLAGFVELVKVLKGRLKWRPARG